MAISSRHRQRNKDVIIHGWAITSSGTFARQVPIQEAEEMWDQTDSEWRDKLYRWVRYREHLPVRPLKKIETRLLDSPIHSWALRGRHAPYQYWAVEGVPQNSLQFSGHSNRLTINDGNRAPWPASKPQWPTNFTEGERDALLQKALAKARTAAWDVGTFVAEFNKTARMIRNVGKGVTDRVDRILSNRSIQTFEDFSSAWLEYRYGWRILYYDIMEANESILRLRGMNPLSSRYTAFDSKEETGPVQTRYSPPVNIRFGISPQPNPLSYTVPDRQQINVLCSTTRSVELRAGVGLSRNLEEPGFIDPLVTAVEIIPYTLVANWFFNLKDFVEAWSPFATGKVAYGFVTDIRKTTYTAHYQYNGKIDNWYNIEKMDIPSTSTYYSTVERQSRQPVMSLRYRVNFDLSNLVDAIAMVIVGRNKLRALRFR